LTPSTAQASFVAGYPSDINLAASQTVAFSGLVYIKVAADAAVVESPVRITTNTDGTFAVVAKPLASLAIGHYTGNFTINVCTDVNCDHPVAGAPFTLPYDIEVLSPDGSVATFNLSPLVPLSGAPNWGTFQGNASHTGFVPVTLNASAFNPRWKWNAPAYAGTQWSPSALTTGAGMFYVASGPLWNASASGHELFAYKEDDGSKVWSHSFGDLQYATTNPPAFSGGKVFIAAGSQSSTYMFSFDAASGTQLFKASMSSQWEHYFAPTILNGRVYTDGGTYGGMYAFDTTTGATQFFANVGQFDGWTPAVDANYAYSYAGGTLGVYDSQTGALVGSISDPTYAWNGYTTAGAPVLGAANNVYAGNLSNQASNSIVNFDTSNRTVRWVIQGAYSGNPAYAAGTLYAPNNSPFVLEAYDEASGAKVWTWTPPPGNTKFVSDVLVTSNLVFVSTDTTTFAIDRSAHAPVWSYAASGSLALSANGVLYIKGLRSIVAINLH
jgi:outer membrane protein assembly factor BamB